MSLLFYHCNVGPATHSHSHRAHRSAFRTHIIPNVSTHLISDCRLCIWCTCIFALDGKRIPFRRGWTHAPAGAVCVLMVSSVSQLFFLYTLTYLFATLLHLLKSGI